MTRNPSNPKGFTHFCLQVFSTPSWRVTTPTMALTVERVTFPVEQPKWIIDNRILLTAFTIYVHMQRGWNSLMEHTDEHTNNKVPGARCYSCNCGCCSAKLNSFCPYIHFKCSVHKATFRQPAKSAQPTNTSVFSVCVSICVFLCVSIFGSQCLRQIKACWLSQKAVFTLLTEAVLYDCFPHVLSTPKTW